jgi:colanic acid biosynthesis glycosyl transferase WcaI
MRFLFITPYFVPDCAGGSMIYAAIAEELVKLGHSVTVLTGMPYYGKERVWDEYRGRFFLRERQAGFQIVRVFSLVARRTNKVGRLLSWALFNLQAGCAGLCLPKHDVIFALNPFTMSLLPLHLIKAIRGTPVIYDVEDVYPDAIIQAGLLKNRAVVRIVGWLEGLCYKRAAAIRVISDGMRRQLIERGLPPGKLFTIPNMADTEQVRPLPRQNSLRERLGLGSKFVALYAGNMGMMAGLDNVLRAAALLKNVDDVEFLFVGEGMCREELQSLAARLELNNVRFLPFQPVEDLPELLASANVSLVTLKAGFTGEAVPSKAYWILASGRPVVAVMDVRTELAQIVNRAQCGVHIEPDSPQALAKKLLELRLDPTEVERMGARARDYVVRFHSKRGVAEQLEALAYSISGQVAGRPEAAMQRNCQLS